MSEASEAIEEESIKNIANFIQATNPTEKSDKDEDKNVTRTEQSTPQSKNMMMLGNRNIGVHRLPASIESRPILSKTGAQQLSQISIKPAMSRVGSGVSISKLKSQESSPSRSPAAKQVKLPSSISFTKMETSTPKAAPVDTSSKETGAAQELSSKVSNPDAVLQSRRSVSVSRHVEMTKVPSEPPTTTAIKISSASPRMEITRVTSEAPPPVNPQSTEAPTTARRISVASPRVDCNTVSVSQLMSVTRQLESDPSFNSLLLQQMTSEELRNLCDGTTALHLSGESNCSDLDTLSLYRTVVNISSLKDKLKLYDKDEFTPLTNIACRISFCHNLQKLVYKEPNLKGFIANKIGEEELSKFDNLVNSHTSRGDVFVSDDVEMCVALYHKIRNISLKYVLTKLKNVYIKMKPMFSSLVKTEEFDSCVARLASLVNSDWEKEVRISEETAYDFDFLFTILKYIKKVREQPSVPPVRQKTDSQPSLSRSVTLTPAPPSSGPSKTRNEVSRAEKDSIKVSVTPEEKVNKDPVETTVSRSINTNEKVETPQKSLPPPVTAREKTPVPVVAEETKRIIITKPQSASRVSSSSSGSISVGSLHDLKKFLETSEEPQQRVIRGVGEQAFKEFLNLVSSLQDQSLLIEDFNIRTLYFTILNFSKFPLTSDMKNLEPLSNFSLRLQPFVDLKNLFVKDLNIREIISERLGSDELDNFERNVDTIVATERDFIQREQEKYIVLYHKVRNAVAESLITRMRGIHAKISSIQIRSPGEKFTISLRMLQSLMDSQFNGQVLIMEKSRYNFDFLSSIMEFLQQISPSDYNLVKTAALIEKPRDPMVTLIESIKKDLEDIGLLQSVENILSKQLCSLYVSSMDAIVDTNRLSITQKRALFSLRNAIFLSKNNFKVGNTPLTNVSLEASKFSALSKFINKDAGIKSVIAEKHGAVTFKELEALVRVHSERGDEFVVKFVEKNVELYHSLRNTALEKILHQITVVHSKVKNIEVPETAKNSVQYHQAIKRLDDIVGADQVTKMTLIEEQKFDFEFLSTILLVWRTVTSKPTEAQKENSGVRGPSKVVTQQPSPVSRQPLVQSRNQVQILPLRATQLLPRPTTGQVIQIRPGAGQLIPVRQPAGRIIPLTQQVIQMNRPSPPHQQMRRLPPVQPNLQHEEESVDDPVPVLGEEEAIIVVEDDIKPDYRTSVVNRRNSDSAASSNLKPIATVPPMPTNMVRTVDTPNVLKPVRQHSQVAPSKSLTTVATVSNPLQVISGQGELPIRTKCVQCNDRTSENMEQLIHHYSLLHFRDQLEKDYVRSEKCPGCPEVFKDKTDLIKHIGYIHGTVQLVLTKTERWICNFCRKEFLTNDFLKKHLIKTHFEKKFESTFLALSENNEILCQFCDKTFSHKKNLFCHIGLDHNKLEEFLSEEKKDSHNDIKCRHCDLEASLHALKSHYISTHYRDTFHSYCSDQGLLPADKSCKFCLITFEEESSLLEHLGLEHNLIYKLIANFQGKVVSATYRPNMSLKSLSEMMEKKLASEAKPETVEPEPEDPLLTETVFVDTSQEILSPVKSLIKIISPSKLMVQPKNNNETTEDRKRTSDVETTSCEGSPATKKSRTVTNFASNPLFQQYKTFCVQSSSNPSIKRMLQSGFRTFDAEIFESFLEYFCLSKSNIPKVKELLEVFSEVYPEESVDKLQFVSKFLSLREYSSYCETVKTTPEQCNPMQLVIFLSQVLAMPGVKAMDLPWLIQRISNIHNKVDGLAITKNKKIRDFFEAVDQKLEDDDIEEVDAVNDKEEEVKGSEIVEVEKNRTPKKKDEKTKESTEIVVEKEVIESREQEPRDLQSDVEETTIENDILDSSSPRVNTEIESTQQSTEKTQTQPELETAVKLEKPEDPPTQQWSQSLEPEVIDLDDDEEETQEYKYFCLECEGCAGNPSCDHTTHPRVLIPFDLRSHFKTTGHVAVSPIGSFASLKKISDIAYSTTYGASVRKQWKDLVLAGNHKPTPFSGVKKCKWNKCSEIFEDAVDAFKHIRDCHLKSDQNKQKKRKSESSLVQPPVKSSKC